MASSSGKSSNGQAGYVRYVEDIDAAREAGAHRPGGVEQTAPRADELGHMYTLSIMAAIFLPIGLLRGLLGINVGGIPGTESPWLYALGTDQRPRRH